MSGHHPLPAGTAELLRLFSGRRRARRVACQLEVECRGRRSHFRGQMVNISRTGGLIGLRDRSFRAGEAGLLTIVGRIHTAFPKGMQIRVSRLKITLRAKVVRVAHETSQPYVLLGCEFQRPLTAGQCEVLGAAPDGNERTD